MSDQTVYYMKIIITIENIFNTSKQMSVEFMLSSFYL